MLRHSNEVDGPHDDYIVGERELKPDYWNVSEEQIVKKTGKPLTHWKKILDAFGASTKESNDVVAHLQQEYDVPRYWARTLTTHYLKQNG